MKIQAIKSQGRIIGLLGLVLPSQPEQNLLMFYNHFLLQGRCQKGNAKGQRAKNWTKGKKEKKRGKIGKLMILAIDSNDER